MIPSRQENPNGLHGRYNVTKADGSECDPHAVYFVLRLDGSSDHVKACRSAARSYAVNAQSQVGVDLLKLVDCLERSIK